MDATNDLLPLLPEVQDALAEEFDGIECSMGPGVVLAQAPFKMPFAHLGKQVTYVPDVTCLEEYDGSNMHRINLGNKSAIFTDGESGCCLELVLGCGKDWRTPLTKLFDRLYPNKWAFFIVELEQGQATYHVLSSSHPAVSSIRREDTPDSTEQSSTISSTPSVSESSDFSLWIVPVTKIFAIPAPKKVRIVKKIVKKRSPGEVVDPNEPKERKIVRIVKKKVEKKEPSPPQEREISPFDSVIQSASAAINGNSSTESCRTLIEAAGTSSAEAPDSDGSASELRRKLSEKIIEEKFMVNGETRRLIGGGLLGGSSNSILQSRTAGLRPSNSRSSMTPDRRLDPILEGSPTLSLQKEDTPKCRVTHPSVTEFPVVALQLVLTKCFTYQQLGKLREVHPHWDEIAGQLLNGGYYKLLERSDKLLMALQRKVITEPALNYAVSVMTSIQVHILNPVDVMRAVIDEGVCCFPYGIILDKTFLLLDHVQSMLDGNYADTCNWEPVATIAKRAASHYRTHLEHVMEDRMGENLRLKAAQRIIRLDSFMVDAQVQKLEKETSKAKDDLRWEIEQLQQRNSQLRKENRELKANQMKLESRVDALEGKFKTLARLLG